jgi:asparagine synthase (glutamine-hydrolysing)
MCGVAGCYQQDDGAALAASMSERIAHRGPDACGTWSYEDARVRAHLAHRRLSIIDLSDAADQPMSKDGLTIIYNGELYNYREIRAELAAAGAGFGTSSDTEVVLEAWRRWGDGALRRFRGMFAFALFDERTGNLVLARDQLVIKPMHYLRRHGGVVFASELKALVSAVGTELRTDMSAIIASMLYYWLPEQHCVAAGVEKLRAGSWIEFRPDGSSQQRTYWQIAEVAAEAAEGPPADLGEVIEDAVSAHLVADVPVSTFLSGGLDSSLLTVLAKRADPGVDAYTIAFRPEDNRLEAMPDDAGYARKVAAEFGIDLREIEVAPDVVELLPRIVDVLDEPIGDPAAINTLLMCEAARDAGVKVLLSGMGADELFGGYRKHLACLMGARYRRLPGPVRGALEPAVRALPVRAFGRGLRYPRWAKRFVAFAGLPEEAAFRRSYTMYDPDELTGLLNPDLAPHVDKLIDEHRATYHDNLLDDHVNRMCLADARLFLPGLNLTYTDRASMAASTEVRVPFVDPTVVRAAFSIAGPDKIRGRIGGNSVIGLQGKLALKRAAESWLPREIVYRPKASFSVPLRAWVSKDLREQIDDVLLRGELVDTGVLNRAALARLVDEERAGRKDRSKEIWQLLTLETWVRQMRSRGVSI